MGRIASPYIVLALFVIGSLCCYIGGCTVTGFWYPTFTIIPALLTAICGYLFMATDSETGTREEGCVTQDGWAFMMACFGAGLIALPVFLYHYQLGKDGYNKKSLTSLLIHLAGDVLAGVGCGLFMALSSPDDGIQRLQ
jgi:hypothetical protein